MAPPYGHSSRKIDVLQPYSYSVLTSMSCTHCWTVGSALDIGGDVGVLLCFIISEVINQL